MSKKQANIAATILEKVARNSVKKAADSRRKKRKRIGDSTGNGKAVSSLYPGISDFYGSGAEGEALRICLRCLGR